MTEKQARLASLLPLVTRLASADGGVLSTGINANEFVEVRPDPPPLADSFARRREGADSIRSPLAQALEDVRELREFSAVLYGSWDRDNIDASCVL